MLMFLIQIYTLRSWKINDEFSHWIPVVVFTGELSRCPEITWRNQHNCWLTSAKSILMYITPAKESNLIELRFSLTLALVFNVKILKFWMCLHSSPKVSHPKTTWKTIFYWPLQMKTDSIVIVIKYSEMSSFQKKHDSHRRLEWQKSSI